MRSLIERLRFYVKRDRIYCVLFGVLLLLNCGGSDFSILNKAVVEIHVKR